MNGDSHGVCLVCGKRFRRVTCFHPDDLCEQCWDECHGRSLDDAVRWAARKVRSEAKSKGDGE